MWCECVDVGSLHKGETFDHIDFLAPLMPHIDLAPARPAGADVEGVLVCLSRAGPVGGLYTGFIKPVAGQVNWFPSLRGDSPYLAQEFQFIQEALDLCGVGPDLPGLFQ